METHNQLKIDKNKVTYRLFTTIADNARMIIIVGVLLALGLAFFIPKINIDTSVEAFIDPGHSSLIYRNQVKETFGLSDPILLAVVNEDGIYNPETLEVITRLTDTIQLFEGVDPDRITSLATENNIYGTEDGMMVEPFIEGSLSDKEANAVKEAVNDFPLYLGNLASEDGTTTLIVVELLDKKKYGAQVYYELLELAQLTEQNNPRIRIHVAGEGAVVEHLGQYVQDDAKLMTPLAFLVITVILFLAYRTVRGVFLSNMVVMGALLSAMGVMVAMDVPFYLVSNIIPVIIIAISVADSIHILGHYYETVAKYPGESSRNITIHTMQEMWRPVLVTSITNIVGFIAMGYSSTMPPMRAVGLYSSLGVLFAWVFSIFVLPAILVILKPQHSNAFKPIKSLTGNTVDRFGKIMSALGNFVVKQPGLIMGIAGIVVVLGVFGMLKMELNDSMVEYFNKKEPIYKADQLMNDRMNGSNFFDIVIEADEVEGLFNVEYLKKIEKLEQFIESQPHVKGANSIIDILKQMNKSINENQDVMYSLPDDSDLIAQYFLLYSASSDPTDLEQYVDYDYKMANIRVMMDNGQFKHIKGVLEETRKYINEEFTEPGLHAKVSGWLNVLYYWIGNIQLSHYLGVILTMVIVILITSLSFRSLYAGILAVIPVTVAVFLNYAIMGFSGIWLKVSTSITVAIAIGVAVDFAVHTIDRLLVLTKDQGKSINEALVAIYPSTGRALLFNLFALALGFGVNMVSNVPPWATFGFLVMTMVSVSFLASLTLLPAMIKGLQPCFLMPVKENHICDTGIEYGEPELALVKQEIIN